jgi:hypothetical protein
VLTSERPETPRAGGDRQALQALVVAREGAVNPKCAGLCQLRDLLITAPEPLRSALRPLTQAPLLRRLATTRPGGRRDPELRGSLLALRSIARRILQLIAEERELAREIETITRKLAPQLLDQPGVGPHAAAQLVLSWFGSWMTGEGCWTWLNGWELEASPDADRSSCSGRLCGLGHGLRPHFLATAGPNVAERVPRGSDREPRADGNGLPAVPLELRPPRVGVT